MPTVESKLIKMLSNPPKSPESSSQRPKLTLILYTGNIMADYR